MPRKPFRSRSSRTRSYSPERRGFKENPGYRTDEEARQIAGLLAGHARGEGASLGCCTCIQDLAARAADARVLLTPPPAAVIFQRAQDAWEARRLPTYVEFDVAFQHHYALGKEVTGSEHVLLRTFDHWCRTREVESDTGVTTSIGPSCVGPALSPLGFNISAQYPTSTQIDPFVGPLRTITSVRALHYTVTFDGEQVLDGHRCYHLLLQPIGNPDYYPLRAVWADEATYDVHKLTYAMHQNGWSASIDYSFRQFPPNATWWIESIDASWTPPPHDTADTPYTSTLELENVAFPTAP